MRTLNFASTRYIRKEGARAHGNVRRGEGRGEPREAPSQQGITIKYPITTSTDK
jgi:hypothetical protein